MAATTVVPKINQLKADETANLARKWPLPVTVIVTTLDEELHINRCLASVEWAAERIVVDAESGDATRALAVTAGARVIVHPWESYSAQKNWALDHASISTEWVLFLDADEAVSAELARAIGAVTTSGGSADGYYVYRSNHFLGRPLKHAWWYPDPVLRLFRVGRGRYDTRSVHERVVVDGITAELPFDLVHENVKGVRAFLERHNRYSSLEAEEIFATREHQRSSTLRPSFRGDRGQRRRALKELVWWRMPILARPVIRLLYLLVWRRAFLDGVEGVLYSLLITAYEVEIDAKYVELQRRAVRDRRP